MYNNRTNIKIKLDDKVLEKVNQVDETVERVDQLYTDFDIYKEDLTNEQVRFENEITNRQDNFENSIINRQDNFENSIINRQEEFENNITEEVDAFDARKQNKLVAGNFIEINEDDPEHPIISSIGGTWDEIKDKPTLNGEYISGNITTHDLQDRYHISKAEAMFYDEYGELDKDGKKYWYMSTDVNSINGGAEEVRPYLILDSEGNPVPYDFGKGGGGGGGGGGDTDIKVNAINYPTTVSLGTPCRVTISWSSLKDEIPTGPGSISVLVNGVTKYTRNNVPQGEVTFDVGPYLASGSNKVSFVATDAYDNQGRVVILINAIEIELTSTFDPNRIFSGIINYTYTPVATVPKTMYFYVDGELYGTDIITVSGEQQTYQISGLTHGAHSLDVYFTCIIDESEVQSNTLSYDLIYAVDGDPTPIISSTFTDLDQEQYVQFNIPYRVYTPGYNYSSVQLIVNGEVIQTLTVNQDTQYWEYRSSDYGLYVMTIKTGNVEKTFNVNIAESTIDVQPVTANLALYLTSYGRSNAEAHPEIWNDDEHHINCTLTNFNFSSNGWVKDSDGNTVLRLNGDARVDIPYQPFRTDFRSLGKTIEIEFATSIVKDYEARIISCWSGDRGIYITPQLALIKSQQSELQTQYKEDDHIRLAFVIEKTSETHLILMYINGIMSGAYQYPLDDNFRQLSPVNISLGSNDATLDIYNIRVYNNNLNRKQVVNNWIADTQNGDLKAERYYSNDVFNDSGEVVASKLPSTTPYIIWDIDPLPQYKGDKRKGQAYFKDPIDTSRDFKLPLDDAGKPTGEYNVQGTSSAVYPVKNIRLKSKQGFINDEGIVNKKFYITPGGIGANYFTYKVDYASSEGANNVELVRLYNDASKNINVLTPPQKQDDKVRVGIDGFPIVAFHRDNRGNDSFTTKANFNNDKANEDVYGFAEGDESWEITNNSADEAKFKKPATAETFENAFEIRFPDEDGYSDLSKLGPMTEWVCSTDPLQATDEPIEPISFTYTDVVRAEDGSYNTKVVVTDVFDTDSAEYRKSKFKAELADWFNINSTIFYYIFTHLFLMVDSRAKNAFPTYFASREPGDGGNHWFWLPYDMDTALGINNEGKLVFNYNLEDTDKVDGADVFNGQESVMWCNLREMFDGEIGQMYSELRKSGNLINFDEVEDRFIKHQSTWPENVFNEDSYEKYIVPLIKEGNNYLEMLQGSKAEQRRWWLYNRFKYFDSKYLAGDAKVDVLQFRAYDVADITITPYADIYAAVSYMNGAAGTVSVRAEHDKSYTLPNPLSYANDQETYIYSASQLKSVGDLSPFKPDTVKAANAVKLQELKVGDGNPLYVNPNLKELTLGRNILLSSLDVRNCINLTQSIDISNCTNIEHVYFDGTKITGLALPVGGIIKTLHLPDTMTNITIRNQPQLNDLQIAGTSRVQTLWLENIPFDTINAMSIIRQMPEGAAVRLVGFEDHVQEVSEIRDAYDLLDTMTGINAQGEDVPKAQVNGKIYIDTISYSDWAELSARYIDIQIIANHILCTVTFINDGEVYDTQIVDRGHDATEPEDPSKPSTAQYYYTFEGWDQSFENVQSNLTITALYDEHIQVYEFKFDTQTTKVTIPSQFIEYGQKAVKPEDPELPGSLFLGWFNEPEGINEYDFNTLITGPKTVYGKWKDEEEPLIVDIRRDAWDTFSYTISDNIAVTKYAVTMTETIPDEWIEITPVEVFEGSYRIDSAGTYYIWGSDAVGLIVNRSIIAYGITENASVGAELSIKEGEANISGYALQGTELTISASKDSHYDDLKLFINSEEVDNPIAKLIEENIEVEVTCTPHIYTVSFDVGEHGEPVEDQYIVYLDKVVRPSNQYEEGLIIDGWLLDGELYDFDTPVSSDFTLVANWVEYIAPTRLTVNVDANDEIFVNVTLGRNSLVKVNFGDGSEDRYVSDISWNSLSHIYEEAGEYIIEITCEQGTHLLGYNTSNQCINPASKLINVEFAYNMATTSANAFTGAYNLRRVELTDYMTSIAPYAFSDCYNSTLDIGLEEVVIPENITSIGSSAFNGCSKLHAIELHDGITSIGSSAFALCSSLGEIHIPASLTKLNESTFNLCTSLQEVDIPVSVSEIGSSVFNGCTSLSKVIIRNSEIVYDLYVFNRCFNLTSVGPLGGDYSIEVNWGTEVADNMFECGTTGNGIRRVVLSEGITRIGVGSFMFCNQMNSIELPSTLEVIDDSAFLRCSALSLTSLPNSVRRIGSMVFAYCSGVKITELPSNLEYIDAGAFTNNTMTSINIPFSVLSIGNKAFENCSSLRNAYIHCPSSDNKVNTYSLAWFKGCSSNLMLHIPSSLVDIQIVKENYGDCWNFYGDGKELQYVNDLD